MVEVGVSASQEQTLSDTGARVYTAHRGWFGVVTGISAASTGGVLVPIRYATGNFDTPTLDGIHVVLSNNRPDRNKTETPCRPIVTI